MAQKITIEDSKNITIIQAKRDVHIHKAEKQKIALSKGKKPLREVILLREAIPPFSLPYLPNPQFTDPHQYLQKLHQELSTHQTIAVPHLQAVIGMGGIGKTQLAIEYAYSYRQAYSGGIFWVQGADGVSLVREFVCLAPVIGISKKQDERDANIIKEVAEYLSEQGTQALLIIDNLQTLNRLSQQIGETNITIETLKCSILFTTRLNCSERYSSVKLDVLPQEQAILLLCHRLMCRIEGIPWRNVDLFSADKIKATFSKEEYEKAEHIVCLLGCLPLAVIITGTCIAQQVLAPGKTQKILTDFYQRLKGIGVFATLDGFLLSPEDLATKHDPIMKETIRLSYEMLTDSDYDQRAKALFRIIPVFPEAISIRLDLLAIAAGIEDENAWLSAQRLLNLSLVVDATDNILRIHPLIRQFADELYPSNEREEIFVQAMQNFIKKFADPGYLEQRARQLPLPQGLDGIADDFLLLLNLISSTGFQPACQQDVDSMSGQLSSLLRAFSIERRFLEGVLSGGRFETVPAFFYQQWQNRLFEEGLVELSKSILPPDYLSSAIWLKNKRQMKTTDPALVRIFSGHEGYVNSVSISADGKRLASGSDNETVRLWDTETGKEIQRFVGHEKLVRSVSLSADGKRLASGSDDKTVRLWDTETGKEIQRFVGHEELVSSVSLSADGKRLASGSGDKTVRLWDTETGRLLAVYPVQDDSLAIQFSQNNREIYVADKGGAIHNLNFYHLAIEQILKRNGEEEKERKGEKEEKVEFTTKLSAEQREDIQKVLVREGLMDKSQSLPEPYRVSSGVGEKSWLYFFYISDKDRIGVGLLLIAKFQSIDRQQREWEAVKTLNCQPLPPEIYSIFPINKPEDPFILYRAAGGMTPSGQCINYADYLILQIKTAPNNCFEVLEQTKGLLWSLYNANSGRLERAPVKWADFWNEAFVNDRRQKIEEIITDTSGRLLLECGSLLPFSNPMTNLNNYLSHPTGTIWLSQIHGDLNLTNILVLPKQDGSVERVVIIDFACTKGDRPTAIDFVKVEAEFFQEVFPEFFREEATCMTSFIKIRDYLDGRETKKDFDEIEQNIIKWVARLRKYATEYCCPRAGESYLLNDYFYCLYFYSLNCLTYKTVAKSQIKQTIAYLCSSISLKVIEDVQKGCYSKGATSPLTSPVKVAEWLSDNISRYQEKR